MKPKINLRPQLEEGEGDGNLFFASRKSHLEFISTGTELLDCVLGGGWALGRVANLVGDKSTGKTLLAIEAMANFLRLYPEGKAVYDETEAAFDAPYAEALGLRVGEIEMGESVTVEDLFKNITDFLTTLKGNPGLYIVDSLDALSDKAEMARGIEDSTYGASKPKQLGQLFRRLVKTVQSHRVAIIIISQVRDAIGVSFGAKQTRSGGRALDFYASQIVWLANVGQIKKTINSITRTVGVEIKAKTSKNKIGQPFRECTFSILFGYGVDDISSGLEYLKETHHLSLLGVLPTAAAISSYRRRATSPDTPPEEAKRMREEVSAAVRKTWYEIEKTFTPKRGKYIEA